MTEQPNPFEIPIKFAEAGCNIMNAMMQAATQGMQMPMSCPLSGSKPGQEADNPSMKYLRALQARSYDQVMEVLAPNCVATGPFAGFSRTNTNEEFAVVLRDNIWPVTIRYDFRKLVSGDNEGVLIYDWITKASQPIRIAVHQTYEHGRIAAVELFFDPAPVVELQRRAKK